MKLWESIIDATDDYAKQSTWTDFSLLKICLAAFGVMIGLSIPKQNKRSAFWVSAIVYTITSIPLMLKFLPILKYHIEKQNDYYEDE